MIVLLAADGVVVRDVDDLDELHLRTELDAVAAQTALQVTGSGELSGGELTGGESTGGESTGADQRDEQPARTEPAHPAGSAQPQRIRLDLAVLRSRAELLSSDPDWPRRWAELVERAGRNGRLSADGRSVSVAVER